MMLLSFFTQYAWLAAHIEIILEIAAVVLGLLMVLVFIGATIYLIVCLIKMFLFY